MSVLTKKLAQRVEKSARNGYHNDKLNKGVAFSFAGGANFHANDCSVAHFTMPENAGECKAKCQF